MGKLHIRLWITVISIVCTVSCVSTEDIVIMEDNEIERDHSSSPYRYLALGDSYTIGERVSEDARWPMILAERIKANGQEVSKPMIIARTGWTTDELIVGIENAQVTEKWDIVSLLIGVNNQYRGRDIENFRFEFNQLLDRAISMAYEKELVFVVSIPDWGVMPFAEGRDRDKIGREIDSYNKVVKEECAKSGVAFIDITPISREALNDATLAASDGLHPSEKMYQRWVDEVIYIRIEELVR